MVEFNEKSRPRTKEDKHKKRDTLYERQELTLNDFRCERFPIKSAKGKGRLGTLASRPSDLVRVAKVFDCTQLKILTLKQILQRLPIALAQVQSRNKSENILNEIRQLIYYFYGAKKITKKVYNNIMNSIKV